MSCMLYIYIYFFYFIYIFYIYIYKDILIAYYHLFIVNLFIVNIYVKYMSNVFYHKIIIII